MGAAQPQGPLPAATPLTNAGDMNEDGTRTGNRIDWLTRSRDPQLVELGSYPAAKVKEITS